MPAAPHLFIDESFAGDYYIVAGAVMPADLDATRRQLRPLVQPGQRRLHMKHERDDRKRQILGTLESAGVTATVYTAPAAVRPIEARRACLRELVADAARRSVPRLVFELDDSALEADRRTLYAATREYGCPELRYDHLRAHEEILLCAADAIAWAWAKGGSWRALVRPIVTGIYPA